MNHHMKNWCTQPSRRHFLGSLGGAGIYLGAIAGRAFAADAPAKPVAIAKCDNYTSELLPALTKMFDQLGGLAGMVKGKTVAMKINMVGGAKDRVGFKPHEETYWTHPKLIGAVTYLLGNAGAQRVRILEGSWSSADPLEEYMMEVGWKLEDILRAAPRVEFENTNVLGRAKKYSRLTVPGGGHIFDGFDLNHSYADCDFFVSIGKMKEHATAGITLSIKNMFGSTPVTIYGEGAGVDEPSLAPHGGRGIMHSGVRQPSKSAPSENDPKSPRDGGYRIPRIISDIVAARPIHLAIVDAIDTMTGGEGPWIRAVNPVHPGLLIAGLNPVNTDAVGAALMGFDPMAVRGTAPFETCDSTLLLAEQHGIGTRDLRRIEVIGPPISDVRLDYRAHRAVRRG
jgi:uncharacterized protein (DUF362 family)